MTPFIVMEVLDRAKEMQSQGIDVIHLEVGEPDFNMPQVAVEAAQNALAQGITHYTNTLGFAGVRQAIAAQYLDEYGVSISPDQIVMTSGSSPAILSALMLLCSAGDEVLISNPCYSCYRNFVLTCGAVPCEVPLSAEDGFQFDAEEVAKRITPRTKALIINSPMNPTGTLLQPDVLQRLAGLGLPIISDEIYQGLVYEGKAHSMLEYTSNTFIINGFSKRYAMTGMRLGYMVAPKEYMPALIKLQQNLFICAPSVAQVAGMAAIEHSQSECQYMHDTYNARRKYLINRLRQMGFVIHTEPEGAFYIFADARMFTQDSYAFAIDLLEKAHVGVTPGIDFGSRGEGFIRFSYANSMERIAEAMDRVERFLMLNA